MKKLLCSTVAFMALNGPAFAGGAMSMGGPVVNWASVSQTVANLCNSAVMQNATINQTNGGGNHSGGGHSSGVAMGGAGGGMGGHGWTNIPSVGVSSNVSVY